MVAGAPQISPWTWPSAQNEYENDHTNELGKAQGGLHGKEGQNDLGKGARETEKGDTSFRRIQLNLVSQDHKMLCINDLPTMRCKHVANSLEPIGWRRAGDGCALVVCIFSCGVVQ